MTTEFLREKLNTLNNLVLQEAMQVFQYELIINAAKKTTGDAQVDQVMAANAQNARSSALANSRRLEDYRAELALLNEEFDAQTKGGIAS